MLSNAKYFAILEPGKLIFIKIYLYFSGNTVQLNISFLAVAFVLFHKFFKSNHKSNVLSNASFCSPALLGFVWLITPAVPC